MAAVGTGAAAGVELGALAALGAWGQRWRFGWCGLGMAADGSWLEEDRREGGRRQT